VLKKIRLEPLIISLSRKVLILKKLVPHPAFYVRDDQITTVRDFAAFELNKSDWVQWWICIDLPDYSWKMALHHLLRTSNFTPVIVDIGSKVGILTFKLAMGLNRSGVENYKIFSFDPNPFTAGKFSRIKELNLLTDESLRFYLEVLSNITGITKFGFKMDNTGTGSLSGSSIEIQQNTLTTFCVDNSIHKIDFIKIDVEGFEPFVLEGVREIIERGMPAMYIEISPKMFIFNIWTAEEIFNYLFS